MPTRETPQKGVFFVKGYNIEVKNNLIEPKHIQNMGAAVWLYMWCLDKITSINENGVGKVLGTSAITHQTVEADLGIDRRTYQRWIKKLRDTGYIKTVRVKHGLVISVNKATKTFGKRSDKSVASKAPTSAKNVVLDETKMSLQNDKSGTSLYKEDKYRLDNSSKDIAEIEISETAQIGVLYYQAVKELKLPVLNHITIKSKIKQMEKEDELQNILNYLKFLKEHYKKWEHEYKPQLNNALDIYNKRVQIKNALQEQINKQNKPKGRGFTVKKR